MTVPGGWAYYSARGIQALRLFAAGSLSVPELAERLQVGQAAARRLVGQLDREGLVEVSPYALRRRYRLASGGYELGLVLIASGLREMERREVEHRAFPVRFALLRYRRARGISQERFAEMVGFGYNKYTLVEHGRREVAGAEVVEFADRLGVDVLELLTLGRGGERID